MKINQIDNWAIYLMIFLLPFISSKLILLLVAFIVYILAKAFIIVVTKKQSFVLGYFDLPVVLFALTTLASAAIKTPNKMDAIVSPGIASIIVLSSILYFLVNQMDAKEKKNIVYTLISSGTLTSISILLSLTKIVSLPIDYLTASVFLLSIALLGINQIIKEVEFTTKFLLGSIIAIVIFAFSVSVYTILPGKPSASKIIPLSESWEIASSTLKESPILGIGPGNYLTAFNKYRSHEINKTDLWSTKFTTASNSILTMLTETGILGFLTFFILIFYIIKNFHNKIKERKLVGWGLGSSFDLLAVLFLIISLFATPMALLTMATFFVLLGLTSEKVKESSNIWPVILILWILILYPSYNIISADIYFSKSIAASNKNNVLDTYKFAKRAIKLNPKVDKYHTFLSKINLTLAGSLAQKKDLNDEDRKQVTVLVQEAINEAKASVALNDKRADNWEFLGKTYQSLIPIAESSEKFAVDSYNQAIALDPVNPSLRMSLGDVYFLTKDYKNAIENYKLAVYAKDDLANAHFNLGKAFVAAGEKQKAKDEFNKAISLLPSNSEDIKKIQSELNNLE